MCSTSICVQITNKIHINASPFQSYFSYRFGTTCDFHLNVNFKQIRGSTKEYYIRRLLQGIWFQFFLNLETKKFQSVTSVRFNQTVKSHPERHSYTVTAVTSNFQRIEAVIKGFVHSGKSLVTVGQTQCQAGYK